MIRTADSRLLIPRRQYKDSYPVSAMALTVYSVAPLSLSALWFFKAYPFPIKVSQGLFHLGLHDSCEDRVVVDRGRGMGPACSRVWFRRVQRLLMCALRRRSSGRKRWLLVNEKKRSEVERLKGSVPLKNHPHAPSDCCHELL